MKTAGILAICLLLSGCMISHEHRELSVSLYQYPGPAPVLPECNKVTQLGGGWVSTTIFCTRGVLK